MGIENAQELERSARRNALPTLLPMHAHAPSFSLGAIYLPPTPTFPKFTLKRRWVSASLFVLGALLFVLVLWEGVEVPRWVSGAVTIEEDPGFLPNATSDAALYEDLYGPEFDHLRPTHYLAGPPTAHFRGENACILSWKSV